MEKSSSKNTKGKQVESTRVTKQCAICGDSAVYLYYGVIACAPCKVFFRRNAKQGQELLKCDFDGHCEININTRHVCSYCRLMKCFASGMKTEIIGSNLNKINQKRKLLSKSTQTTSTCLVRSNEPLQFPTLNLLRSDQSILSIEQCNLLSNLLHCYDEHGALSIGHDYMHQQSVLPIKLRFKPTLMMNFLLTAVERVQSLYTNNRDFLSLSADDVSTLIQSTMKHTGSLFLNLIVHQIGLSRQDVFYKNIETMSHVHTALAINRIQGLLEFDMIVMKLFLAILSFSTIKYTVYPPTSMRNLSDIKRILHIQDSYTELAWRYLLYRYDSKQAIICFSNLIRCLFAVHHGILVEENLEWYDEKLDSMIQETKKNLVIHD